MEIIKLYYQGVNFIEIDLRILKSTGLVQTQFLGSEIKILYEKFDKRYLKQINKQVDNSTGIIETIKIKKERI